MKARISTRLHPERSPWTRRGERTRPGGCHDRAHRGNRHGRRWAAPAGRGDRREERGDRIDTRGPRRCTRHLPHREHARRNLFGDGVAFGFRKPERAPRRDHARLGPHGRLQAPISRPAPRTSRSPERFPRSRRRRRPARPRSTTTRSGASRSTGETSRTSSSSRRARRRTPSTGTSSSPVSAASTRA